MASVRMKELDAGTAAARPSLASLVTDRDKTVGTITVDNAIFKCRDVNVYYGDKHAIKNVSIEIARNQVLAMIGPSGCGN